MEQSLRDVFDDLGLSQYLEVFLDQGFDTWDTVLDITETDLEALGVKLGHRRKLQRQIRIARGAPPNAALPAANHSDAHYSKLDSCQLPKYNEGVPGKEVAVIAVTKRKYRRHPKPDPHAPERPPSAYVLFSNSTREELKGQSLSFTEIAKIVGENWQHISQEEREKFERRAQRAKDQYRRELAEYKKTAEYEQYSQYLQDFKKQQQLRGKDTSKSSSSAAGGSHRGSTSSCSVDGSDGMKRNGPYQEAEPVSPKRRKPSESECIASLYIPSGYQARSTHPSEVSGSPCERSMDMPTATQSGLYGHQKLPSLSDIFDDSIAGGRFSTSPEYVGG